LRATGPPRLHAALGRVAATQAPAAAAAASAALTLAALGHRLAERRSEGAGRRHRQPLGPVLWRRAQVAVVQPPGGRGQAAQESSQSWRAASTEPAPNAQLVQRWTGVHGRAANTGRRRPAAHLDTAATVFWRSRCSRSPSACCTCGLSSTAATSSLTSLCARSRACHSPGPPAGAVLPPPVLLLLPPLLLLVPRPRRRALLVPIAALPGALALALGLALGALRRGRRAPLVRPCGEAAGREGLQAAPSSLCRRLCPCHTPPCPPGRQVRLEAPLCSSAAAPPPTSTSEKVASPLSTSSSPLMARCCLASG
jgi:hypothetical protein